jgi:glucokinase
VIIRALTTATKAIVRYRARLFIEVADKIIFAASQASTSMRFDLPVVAAVDLGGTKIRSLIVDAHGAILGLDDRPTEAETGPEAVMERLVTSVLSALAATGGSPADLSGIGVAAPGPLDLERGLVLEAPNLPGWHDVPVAAVLGERLGCPTSLENDANAAAVGEHRFGAGQGIDNMIYLTISTGIGGGLILNGQLYRGVDGTAGELGHIVVDQRGPLDDCGMRGCLEVMASGTAIARMASEAVEAGQSDALRRAAVAGKLTAREVHAAAMAGDPTARAILARAAHALAIGLANFINIFNPQLFVIGGGASRMWDPFILPAFDEGRHLAFAGPAATVQLQPSGLGNNSGALGVAALALDRIGRHAYGHTRAPQDSS